MLAHDKLFSSVLQKTIHKIDPPFAMKLELVAQALDIETPDTIQVRRAFHVLQGLDSEKLAHQAISYFQRFKSVVQFLDLIRNITVFIPILLTWFSLSLALKEYASLGPGVGTPFIYLWQSGFDGHLSKWLILSNVAWADAFIVLGIILLTGLTLAINIFSEEKAINRAAKIEKDINLLIWKMQSLLISRYPILILPQSGSLDAVVLQLEKIVTIDHNRSETMINFLAAENERLSAFSMVQATSIDELRKVAISFNQLSSEILSAFSIFQQKLLNSTDVEVEKSVLLDEAISKINTVNSYLLQIKDETTILNIKFNEFAKAQMGFLDEVGYAVNEIAHFEDPIKTEADKIFPEIKNFSEKLLSTTETIQLISKKNVDMIQNIGSNISQILNKINVPTTDKKVLDDLLMLVSEINSSMKLSSDRFSIVRPVRDDNMLNNKIREMQPQNKEPNTSQKQDYRILTKIKNFIKRLME
jgi:hypothetical protein